MQKKKNNFENFLISTIVEKQKTTTKIKKRNGNLSPLSFSFCHKQAENSPKFDKLTLFFEKRVTKY